MKQLFAGIVIIVVLGLAGFFYRNALEGQRGNETACTMDARICPDGTTVGRTGPSCEFAKCAYPNIEYADAKIAFAVPAGYVENVEAKAGNPTMVAAFEQTGTTTPPNAIVVYRFAIPEGKTANDVILENTMLEPSGMQPEDMNDFRPRIVGTETYSSIVIERFEAIVHSAYYLARENDVLRFDVLERDVVDWMKADLIVSNLPEHQTLLKMLDTLSDYSIAE